MENKRRDFLKTACAPVVLSMFGISVLEACSSGDDETAPPADDNSSTDGETSTTVSIDLSSSDFSDLSDIGGWVNYLDEDLLLLRISETEIRAFSNVCPHQGTQNKWSHGNGKFSCSQHGKSFDDTCSSSLTCYTASIAGETLTVTIT